MALRRGRIIENSLLTNGFGSIVDQSTRKRFSAVFLKAFGTTLLTFAVFNNASIRLITATAKLGEFVHVIVFCMKY